MENEYLVCKNCGLICCNDSEENCSFCNENDFEILENEYTDDEDIHS